MKGAMVLLLIVTATVVHSEDYYYFMKHTKRVFDGLSVELTPLIKWWQKSETQARLAELKRTDPAMEKVAPFNDPRPLSAWVRITGRFVEVQAQGWVVDAEIESAPGQKQTERILLKHPPEMEKAQFEALKQRASDLANYGSRMESLASGNETVSDAASQRASRLREVGNASTSVRTYNDMTRAASQYDSQASAYFDRAQRQRANAATAGMNLDQVKEALAKFPPGSGYTIDYLALRKPEKVNSLPVYDLGLVAN